MKQALRTCLSFYGVRTQRLHNTSQVRTSSWQTCTGQRDSAHLNSKSPTHLYKIKKTLDLSARVQKHQKPLFIITCIFEKLQLLLLKLFVLAAILFQVAHVQGRARLPSVSDFTKRERAMQKVFQSSLSKPPISQVYLSSFAYKQR